MSPKPSIFILTGAGISAESGIKTFRDQNGLWENHRIEDVASPEGYRKNPDFLHNFYNGRRTQLLDPKTKPNPGHTALYELEVLWPGTFLLVTQNVDNLHERAGSQKVLHMHGELLKIRCLKCNVISYCDTSVTSQTPCRDCGSPKTLRPHIVWFGETPLGLNEIEEHLAQCDLFVAAGTSGQVYPAAGFVQRVPRKTRKIEINLAESGISPEFNERWLGPASTQLPKFVQHLRNEIGI